MRLELENGNFYNLTTEKRLLLFAANRTGKTLISKKIEEERSLLNETVLLFDKDIMSSKFISLENNKVFIQPFADEKDKINKEINKYVIKNNLSTMLKNVFNEKTTIAFNHFEDINELFDKSKSQLFFDYKSLASNEPYFYPKKLNYTSYYDLDFIKLCLKKPSKILRFFELIDKMNEQNIFSKVENIEGIINGLTPENYVIKDKIITEKLKKCPVCYTNLTPEIIEVILEEINGVILTDEIKSSFEYYVEQDKNILSIIINLIENFDDYYTRLKKEMNESIMFYLCKNYDYNDIEEYNKLIKEIDTLNNKNSKFNISSEKKDSAIYKLIEKEFDIFNEYTKSNFKFTINKGYLEINSDSKFVEKLSMSEQKLLQFIYMKILFLQAVNLNKKEITVIIDDPFDSYDDVYVYNMINIIYDLIYTFNDKIKQFVVLSHDLKSLLLLTDEYKRKNITFKFYWLDILNKSSEIVSINDEFKLMQKIDKNIGSFGLPIKLIEKMVDEYSLIVFSSMMRENSQFNLYVSKKCNRTVKKSLILHKKYYDLISKCINHAKIDSTLYNIFKVNKGLYGYDNLVSKYKYVSEVFNGIPENYYDVPLIKKNDQSVYKNKDLINLFVWKYMSVLKIRRILEIKIWNELKRPKYKTLGDLIKKYDPDTKSKLCDFYNTHRNLFNAFNHSSVENVPPILIFHANYIHDTLVEITEM